MIRLKIIKNLPREYDMKINKDTTPKTHLGIGSPSLYTPDAKKP